MSHVPVSKSRFRLIVLLVQDKKDASINLTLQDDLTVDEYAELFGKVIRGVFVPNSSWRNISDDTCR